MSNYCYNLIKDLNRVNSIICNPTEKTTDLSLSVSDLSI